MPEVDHAIEDWIRRHQDWSDAQLETKVQRMLPHCVDHKAARELLHRRRQAGQSAEFLASERRHRESIAESQASRRLDKWALSVAVIALLVGGAGLWRSFLPAEPERLLPESAFSTPDNPVDPIHGMPPKISAPATEPIPTPLTPKSDKKPKTSPPPPK